MSLSMSQPAVEQPAPTLTLEPPTPEQLEDRILGDDLYVVAGTLSEVLALRPSVEDGSLTIKTVGSFVPAISVGAAHALDRFGQLGFGNDWSVDAVMTRVNNQNPALLQTGRIAVALGTEAVITDLGEKRPSLSDQRFAVVREVLALPPTKLAEVRQASEQARVAGRFGSWDRLMTAWDAAIARKDLRTETVIAYTFSVYDDLRKKYLIPPKSVKTNTALVKPHASPPRLAGPVDTRRTFPPGLPKVQAGFVKRVNELSVRETTGLVKHLPPFREWPLTPERVMHAWKAHTGQAIERYNAKGKKENAADTSRHLALAALYLVACREPLKDPQHAAEQLLHYALEYVSHEYEYERSNGLPLPDCVGSRVPQWVDPARRGSYIMLDERLEQDEPTSRDAAPRPASPGEDRRLTVVPPPATPRAPAPARIEMKPSPLERALKHYESVGTEDQASVLKDAAAAFAEGPKDISTRFDAAYTALKADRSQAPKVVSLALATTVPDPHLVARMGPGSFRVGERTSLPTLTATQQKSISKAVDTFRAKSSHSKLLESYAADSLAALHTVPPDASRAEKAWITALTVVAFEKQLPTNWDLIGDDLADG